MYMRQNDGGPPPGFRAWWRFVIEGLVCLVLVAAIVVIAFEGRHNILSGPAILALAGMIVGIVRNGDRA